MDSIFSFDTLWVLLLIPYVICCFGLSVIVLLQKGKGAGFAGAFGIGPGSDAVFGPRAGKSLLVKMTYVMAFLFMFLAICMSLISGRQSMGIAPDAVTEAEAAEKQQEKDLLNELEAAGVRIDEKAETDAEAAPGTSEGEGAAEETPAQPAEEAPAEAAGQTGAETPESAPAGDAAGNGT